MRSLILGLCVAVGLILPAGARTVAGRYAVHGVNPGGSSYSGTVEIIPRGRLCRIVWHLGSEWRGMCMLSGNTFAAYYHNGGKRGLLIYRLQPDGSLSGVWSIAGGGSGMETLIPMP